SHLSQKPVAVSQPTSGGPAGSADAMTLKELETLEASRVAFKESIAQAEQSLLRAEGRKAVSVRLLDKLSNFRKEYDRFALSLVEDSKELGVSPESLVSFRADSAQVEAIRRGVIAEVGRLKEQLEAVFPPGLRLKLVACDESIAQAKLTLDAPNRAYQSYLNGI